MGRLEEKACSNIHPLLKHLGIDYIEQGNKIISSCPIHGGDNPRAFVLYLTGEKTCGNWKCFTRGCNGNLTDLVCHVLNITEGDAKNLLNKMYDGVEYEPRIIEKKDDNKILCEIDEFKKHVIIPSSYYLKRGFSREILKKFNVGFCNKKSSNMFLRSVIPVFNVEKTGIIGVVGRSVFEECKKCKCYHHPKSKCISGWRAGLYPKWKNSAGFYTGQCLYNIWNLKGDTAILVEGQSDVWRMTEAGFPNTLGVFGMSLKEQQHRLLKERGVKNLILILDKDDAGQKGVEMFKNSYSKEYNYEVKELIKKDVSCMAASEIREFMK